MTSFTFRLSGRLILVVHGRESPAPGEWDAFAAEMARIRTPEACRMLVRSDGGGPNAAQRQQIHKALRGPLVPMVLLTDSLVARGIGALGSLLDARLRVLGRSDLDGAAAYLRLTSEERLRAEAEILALAAELAAAQVGAPVPSAPSSERFEAP